MRSRFLLFSTLALWPFLSAVAGDYEFTYTNPSIGEVGADFVLEYYSVVDCSPCRRFETESLESFLPLVASGRLRVVFRDLPPQAAALPAGRLLFCLQEFPEYAPRRIAFKRSVASARVAQDPLPGLAGARYSSCLSSSQFNDVLSHNRSDFDDLGFQGIPSFSLSRAGDSVRDGVRFFGSLTPSELFSAMDSLTRPSSAHNTD